jgi:hypothetical protein
MIFKVIKFFVKLGIGIMLGLLAFIFVVYVLFNGAKTYYEDSKLPYNDASYVVRAHQICEESEVGTDHICCIPGCEKIFRKQNRNMNACSPEHERQYQEIYKNWVNGLENKENLERRGIRFK